jgi:hypothetical protein
MQANIAGVTQTPQILPAEAAGYEHILADLHEHGRALAEILAAVAGVRAEVVAMRADVDQLLPAARRAAAMLDTPVTRFLAARKEGEAGGREAVQRGTTGRSRARRSRPA